MPKTPEQEIYEAMGRKQHGKHRKPNVFEPYENIYDDYYTIYYEYLLNLLISEFKYENVPVTLNTTGLEWLLRTNGYANIVAVDESTLILEGLGLTTPGINIEFGSLINGKISESSETINKLVNGRDITNLTKLNTGTAKLPVSITMSNKNNYYNGGLVNDLGILDRTAKTLAEIKASMIFNIRQQKMPYMGLTNSGSLASRRIWEQIEAGKPFIAVDADLADDINKLVQPIPSRVPDLSSSLKDSWNNTMNEFLTFVGLDSIAVDKKERLVSSEAESNDQQVSISASSYLDARNSQLELLNQCLGTNMRVRMNFDTLEDTLDIINRDAPQENGDDRDGSDSTDNTDSSNRGDTED